VFVGGRALNANATADYDGIKVESFVHGGVRGDLQTERYSSPPDNWLTMRRGSIAEAREISVKLSSSNNPMN
jgi:hypothetical protein